MTALLCIVRRKPDTGVLSSRWNSISLVLKTASPCSLKQALLGSGVVLHARLTLTQMLLKNLQHTLQPRLALEVDTPSRFREYMSKFYCSLAATIKTLALSLKTPVSVTGAIMLACCKISLKECLLRRSGLLCNIQLCSFAWRQSIYCLGVTLTFSTSSMQTGLSRLTVTVTNLFMLNASWTAVFDIDVLSKNSNDNNH